MERIWLEHYPQGVAHDIDPDQYGSLAALLEEAFARYGERKAYVGLGVAMTFSELDRRSP